MNVTPFIVMTSFTMHAEYKFPILCRRYFRVLGSCNGVICVTNDRFSICHDTFLWNPTIQKCVELPHPNFPFDKIGGFNHELGFGFDETGNDYKLVRIVRRTDWREFPLEVEIYSLRSGIWRNASDLAVDLGFRIFDRGCSHGRDFQVYHNGAVHWVCYDIKQKSCMIIAFDLGNEVFRCFELPMDIKRGYRWMQKLQPVVFRGSLSLIHYSKPKCIIWMMREYGASSSWTNHLEINLSDIVDRVIGIRNNGELMIEIQGGLYSYDPEATKAKKFNFLDRRNLLHWKLIREGDTEGLSFVGDDVRSYDPEAAPKELGIRSLTRDYCVSSFHSESYIESLALLGMMKATEMDGESEKLLEEGNR